MSTNGLIDMTREPWDPERFANCGCLAQLIDGPCNGEVVRFFPGKKVLEIRLNDPKQKFTEQELTKTSTPFKTVEYRLEFFESEGGRTANVIGIWTGSKSGSDWRRLLDDARDYRQMIKAMFQVDGSTLSKALAGIEAEFIKKLEPEKKRDTPAPKEDTGDGTYSTSA